MGEVIQTRTLGLQQKLRVFQQTVEDHQLSLAATALLGGTLFVGSVSWSLGHLSARWHGGSTE